MTTSKEKKKHAIIETGSKQYFVTEGSIIDIEKLESEAKKEVNFDKILLISENETTTLGKPYIEKGKVLEKLKNLSSSPSVHGEELKSLYLEKNQLQSEKIELESKYNNLLSKYNELKLQIKKMEDDQKKTKRIQDKFNQDIEELGEETDSLVEEIEKWQI